MRPCIGLYRHVLTFEASWRAAERIGMIGLARWAAPEKLGFPACFKLYSCLPFQITYLVEIDWQ